MNVKKAAVTAAPLLTLAAFAIATAAPVGHAGSTRASVVKAQTAKTAAATTTKLYAGGATLPALAYVGTVTTNPQVTDASGSVFYYYGHSIVSGEAVSYCQTGSGFGKKVLNGDDASGAKDADLPCAAIGTSPVVATNGFAASGQSVADFAGSDAPLAAAEYTDFTKNSGISTNPIFGRTEPVQLPVLAGAVAVYYNNNDAAVEALKSVPLSDKSICMISTGAINNWSALYTELKGEGLAVGSTPFASKSLYFVSRYDGSGTSFSYTNHLAAVCTKYSIKTFGVNQAYSAIITANPSGAHFVGASGNGAVASCIKASTSCLTYASASPGTAFTIPNKGDGAIGYVEAANVGSTVTNPNGFATVNGKSPFVDLPKAAATVTASTLLTDVTVNQTVNGGGPATTTALTPADKKGCVVVANPSSYANPSAGYPIIAVTNLDFSEKGNLGKSSQEQSLAKLFYTSSNFSSTKIKTVDLEGTTTGKTGYSTLNIPSTTSAITTAVACITAS